MQLSRLIRDAVSGIVRDEGFFDLPLTLSERAVPPPRIEKMLCDRITIVKNGEAVKLYHCEPCGFDSCGFLELTPNSNGIFIQQYSYINGEEQSYGASYGPWLFEEGEEFIVTSLFRHLRLLHSELIAIHQTLQTPLHLNSDLLYACGVPAKSNGGHAKGEGCLDGKS